MQRKAKSKSPTPAEKPRRGPAGKEQKQGGKPPPSATPAEAVKPAAIPANHHQGSASGRSALTGNLPGIQTCCIVHTDADTVKVSFGSDHSCTYSFRLTEPSAQDPAPSAVLVANVIEEVWKLAFATGMEKTKRKVLKAFEHE